MAGDVTADVMAEDAPLPCRVLVRLRIRGRLRTTFAQRSAASADSRYRRATPPTLYLRMPPGPVV